VLLPGKTNHLEITGARMIGMRTLLSDHLRNEYPPTSVILNPLLRGAQVTMRGMMIGMVTHLPLNPPPQNPLNEPQHGEDGTMTGKTLISPLNLPIPPQPSINAHLRKTHLLPEIIEMVGTMITGKIHPDPNPLTPWFHLDPETEKPGTMIIGTRTKVDKQPIHEEDPRHKDNLKPNQNHKLKN